jgi:hypothetical protein
MAVKSFIAQARGVGGGDICIFNNFVKIAKKSQIGPERICSGSKINGCETNKL